MERRHACTYLCARVQTPCRFWLRGTYCDLYNVSLLRKSGKRSCCDTCFPSPAMDAASSRTKTKVPCKKHNTLDEQRFSQRLTIVFTIQFSVTQSVEHSPTVREVMSLILTRGHSMEAWWCRGLKTPNRRSKKALSSPCQDLVVFPLGFPPPTAGLEIP